MHAARVFSKNLKWVIIGISLFALLYTSVFQPSSGIPIPVTGDQPVEGSSEPQLPEFDLFTSAVSNGDAESVRGVYVPGVMALRVFQQPHDDNTFVSSMAGVATQFKLAASDGVTGLIAHNFLAGGAFFNLEADQVVSVVYGDGSVKRYVINQAFQYQALDPDSPYSDFINLETNQQLSSTEVFNLHYNAENQVTFQTCIANGDNLSWGRLFVIANALETN